MKKQQFKTVYVDVPLYKNGVRFVITKNVTRAKKYIRNHIKEPNWEPEFLESPGAFTVVKPDYVCLVWLPSLPKTVQNFASLVHELQHVTFWILSRAGIPLNTSTQEAYSYLIGFLTQGFLTKIRR